MKKKISMLLFALIFVLSSGVNFAASVSAEPPIDDVGQPPIQEGVTEETEEAARIQYEPVASNQRFIMYADMQKGLFAVKNKQSGKIWYSTPNDSQLDKKTKGERRMEVRSQIVIDYVYRADEAGVVVPSSANSQSACVEGGNLEVAKIDNGIRVIYQFRDLEIEIPVEYTITEEYISAKIDAEKIKEGKQCYLIGVSLLPSFGAGNWEDRGYLFVPDGSGAIVNFNNGTPKKTDYERLIFGDDLGLNEDKKAYRQENLSMPVFGIAHENDALFGIVSQGESAASVSAYNANNRSGYNGAHAIMNYRFLTQTTLFENDMMNARKISRVSRVKTEAAGFAVRYYSLEGEDADYLGMADQYREYLVAEKGLEKKAVKPALALDLYGAADVPASFLGIPYTKTVCLTTFEQAEQICRSLQEKGVDNIALRYIGWNNSGIQNRKMVKNANPIGKLGGKNGFTALAQYLDGNGFAFYPDVDIIKYRTGGNGISKNSDAAKNTFGEAVTEEKFLSSVFISNAKAKPNYFLKHNKLSSVFERFSASYSALKLGTIGLSTLGNTVYSDLSEKNGSSRESLLREYTTILSQAKESKTEIAFDNANAYAFPYAQRIFNTPVYSSGYDMFDAEIPFYQIVLHGYVNLTVPAMVQSQNPAVNVLKAAETGSELLFKGIYEANGLLDGSQYSELYSTSYPLWADTAAELYQKYYKYAGLVYDSVIVDHTEVQPDVFVTEFENGIKAIVNYSDAAATVEGTEVAPMDFHFLRGRE